MKDKFISPECHGISQWKPGEKRAYIPVISFGSATVDTVSGTTSKITGTIGIQDVSEVNKPKMKKGRVTI